MAVEIFDLKTRLKTDEIVKLERAVIEAAIAYRTYEPNWQAKFESAVDALIAARENRRRVNECICGEYHELSFFDGGEHKMVTAVLDS